MNNKKNTKIKLWQNYPYTHSSICVDCGSNLSAKEIKN